MDYQQPLGDAADGPYKDFNAGTGEPGSIPPGAAIEAPQREIVNVLVQAGLVPSEADTTQLTDAIVMLITAAVANGAFLNVLQNWTKPQRPAVSALGDVTGTVAVDLNVGQDFTATTTGNITTANPANIAAAVGQKGSLTIDNAGAHVLIALGTYWKRKDGTGAPTLPTGRCRFDFHVVSATRVEYVFGEVET